MLSTIEVLMENSDRIRATEKTSLNAQKPLAMLKKLDYFQNRAAFFEY